MKTMRKKLRHGMSLFLHNNFAEMRETEGNYAEKKNRGIEMSLFIYGILRK